MDGLKECPFCGHAKSRLMHRTEYRRNADGLTAEIFDPDVGFGGEGYREIAMLDFRHIFYRRCNRCGARSKSVKTDWHVRTQEEADNFTPDDYKLWGFEPWSEWAKPWREEADAAWNERGTR